MSKKIVAVSGYLAPIHIRHLAYLNEVSENVEPPVSKHPNADQVEDGNGFYFTKAFALCEKGTGDIIFLL